jgi:hypothetical protein
MPCPRRVYDGDEGGQFEVVETRDGLGQGRGGPIGEEAVDVAVRR